MNSKELAYAFSAYVVGAITALSDLSEVQLFGVVFILGGFLGATGKMIRQKPSEGFSQAICVGMGTALLGILFASMWEERLGRNACVGVALVLAMMGSDGYKLLVERVRLMLGGRRKGGEE